jgi:type VI secretion system VgrG family protein
MDSKLTGALGDLKSGTNIAGAAAAVTQGAQQLGNAGNWGAAANLLQMAADVVPVESVQQSLLVGAGDIMWKRMNDMPKAEGVFSRVMAVEPNRPEGLAFYRELYADKSQASSLVNVLSRAERSEKNEKTKEELKQEIEQLTQEQLAEAQRKTEALTAAAVAGSAVLLSSANALANKLSPAPNVPVNAETIGQAAATADRAADLMRRRSENPDDPEVRQALQEPLEQLERWDELAAVLGEQAALAVDPKEKLELLQKQAAILRDKLGKTEEAAQVYAKILGISPNDPVAKANLAPPQAQALSAAPVPKPAAAPVESSPIVRTPPAPTTAYRNPSSRPSMEERMMAALTPQERQVKLSCPSLDGSLHELLFRKMSGDEGLSQLFKYEVELVSKSPNVPMEDVLGHEMTISVEQPMPAKPVSDRRFFNGYVSSFSFVEIQGEYAVYHAVLRPKMWLLTRNQDCRIWEGKSVPEVVGAILKEYGFDREDSALTFDRGEEYKPREHCVQYNETDFAFVSRLLEDEGIHYFFKHEDGKHKLILADGLPGHDPIKGYESLPFHAHDRRSNRDVEGITAWTVSQAVETDRFALKDFDFVDPRSEKITAWATSPTERKHPRAGDFERYEYTGTVVKMTGYGSQMADSLAKVRAQEMLSEWELVMGQTNARGLMVGATFKISDHPRQDINKNSYLPISASFELNSEDYKSGQSAAQPLTYACRFSAINAQTPFRPKRTTAKPLINGPQTAVVVGEGGSPIHTDKYGRVRVSFPWTRHDTKGHKTSCWLRVSQTWAGQNWGSMHLPHVGHEVIVSFLDGDPDRPIVTGRVYNGKNTPWQKLPDHATRSYIRDQVGNRIVMQSKEEEKGISMYTPMLETHLWMGKQDGLELPRVQVDSAKKILAISNEKLEKSPELPATEGGIIADTAGDILFHSKGSIYNVADGDQATLVGGNTIQVQQKDSFLVTKGKSHTCLGSKQEEVEGEFHLFKRGASVEVNYNAKMEVSHTVSAEVKIGASFSANYGVAVEYSRVKKIDLVDKYWKRTQNEIKQEVFPIPEINKKAYLGKLGKLVMSGAEFKKMKAEKPHAEMIMNVERLFIRCGKSSILLEKDGKITVESTESVTVKTKESTTNAQRKFAIKAQHTEITGGKISLVGNLEIKK